MAAAELDEVLERGLPAVSPVTDVVGVGEAVVLAAGEATAPVSRLKRAPKPRRDRPRLAPDRERVAVSLLDGDEGSIAGKAPSGLIAKGGALGELGALWVEVDDDLGSIPARAPRTIRGERCLDHGGEGVGARGPRIGRRQ